jgi:hypothetical protein
MPGRELYLLRMIDYTSYIITVRMKTTMPETTHSMKGKSMVRSFCIFVVALFTVSAGLAQDINGKWKGQMQSPNGPMDLVFNFKATGDSLSGTVVSPMGELPINNGIIKGNTFSFQVNAGEMTINHQCTVMGDSISMKVPGMQEGEAMEMTLKRLSEGEKQSK